jgi:hypothetical protein
LFQKKTKNEEEEEEEEVKKNVSPMKKYNFNNQNIRKRK